MDHRWILPVAEYYARLNAYIEEVGLPWSVEDCQQGDAPAAELRPILGKARGRAVLDCSCGWGRQSVALAKLGWRVTACDISETSLEHARKFAGQEGAPVEFRVCDMRDLAQTFDRQFDWAVSCYALYEIPTEDGIQQALRGMLTALKPSGKCYLKLRDMDDLMEEQPRHVYGGEVRTPHGRIIHIEDWDYESETQVVHLDAFLREDETWDPSDHFRWATETIGCRKNVLRKADLERLLRTAGFDPVVFLPKPHPWSEVQIVATRKQ